MQICENRIRSGSDPDFFIFFGGGGGDGGCDGGGGCAGGGDGTPLHVPVLW